MVYRRRYGGYRRRRAPARRSGNGVSTALSYAKSAYRVGKFVASIVNAEKKWHDYSSTFTPNTTTGLIEHITDIPLGDEGTDRDGSSVLAKSIYARLNVLQSNSATATLLRVLLIHDIACDPAGVPVSDLSDVLQSVSIQSPMNMDNTRRFRILYDKTFTFSIDGQRCRSIDFYKKISNHIKWVNGTTTAVREGHFYLGMVSNEATNTPTVSLYTRVRFYDN